MNNKLQGQRLPTKGTVQLKHLASGSSFGMSSGHRSRPANRRLLPRPDPARPLPRVGSGRSSGAVRRPDEAPCWTERGFHPPACWKALGGRGASLPDTRIRAAQASWSPPWKEAGRLPNNEDELVEQEREPRPLCSNRQKSWAIRAAEQNRAIEPAGGALEGDQTAGCAHTKPHCNGGTERCV